LLRGGSRECGRFVLRTRHKQGVCNML